MYRHVVRPLTLLVASSVPTMAQSWATMSTNNPGVLHGALVSDSRSVLCFDDGSGTTFGLNHISGNNWIALTGQAPVPSFRTGSAVTSGPMINGTATAFLVGGLETTGTFLIDVLRFVRTPASPPSNQPSFDWVPINVVRFPPPPRSRHACAPFGNAFLLFGGQNATSAALDDTWEAVFFEPNLQWVRHVPSNRPPARRAHAMARGPGGTVVLFGGEDASGALLGDTWVFAVNGQWSSIPGPGPSARSFGPSASSMIYDPDRDMVLLHGGAANVSLDDDWEFNGVSWRQVPANSIGTAPIVFDPIAGNRGVIAIRALQNTTTTFTFTPSPASFSNTLTTTCDAGNGPLALTNVNRSLPISGQNLTMAITGLTPSSLLFGAFELTPMGGAVATPISSCTCMQGLTMTAQTATQFVPNVNGVGTWILPISSSPLLLGRSLEVQGIVFDTSNPPVHPCLVMTTNRCTAVVGG